MSRVYGFRAYKWRSLELRVSGMPKQSYFGVRDSREPVPVAVPTASVAHVLLAATTAITDW